MQYRCTCLYIIIAYSPTIEGTYEFNGKLNTFYKLIQIRVWDRKREGGWMEGIHAHHDIIHCIYCIVLMHSDINECTEDIDDCTHDCYNTVSSYLCDCPTGYELDTDEVTCIGN